MSGLLVAGAVLTGGASRRMGRDKAQIEVGGVAMARRVAIALDDGGCDPVFAVGGDAVDLGGLGLDVVPDGWPGEGPLGAIVTALQHAATVDPRAWTLVVACDLPFLDAATVTLLIETAAAAGDVDAVVATSSSLEPLCALWAPQAATALRAEFERGERSVIGPLTRTAIVTVDVDATALRNINAPEDLPPG